MPWSGEYRIYGSPSPSNAAVPELNIPGKDKSKYAGLVLLLKKDFYVGTLVELLVTTHEYDSYTTS